jgi:hypothetical protein
VTRGYFLELGDEIIPYPVDEEWISDVDMVTEDDVEMRAQAGDIYVFKNWSAGESRLKFRCTQEERDFFQELHEAVGGRERAFYFVPNVSASPMEYYLVRKEKEFRPRCVSVVQLPDGSFVRFYEYEQILTREVDSSVSIEE